MTTNMKELTQPSTLRLLRPKEAAEMLAISPRKLWELTNCGRIPCLRIDRSVRYDPVDLRAWIQRAKRTTLRTEPGRTTPRLD